MQININEHYNLNNGKKIETRTIIQEKLFQFMKSLNVLKVCNIDDC